MGAFTALRSAKPLTTLLREFMSGKKRLRPNKVSTYTLALCYEFQMLEHLDTEEFDIPVDTVIWA